MMTTGPVSQVGSASPPRLTGPRAGQARHAPWLRRAAAGMLFAPASALLLVAASMDPNPAGYGTHTQLGLEACAFVDRTGLPCATCGMTTAFAHAADGDLIQSFRTQPAGAVVALITAMLWLVSGYAMLSGLSLLPLLSWCWRLSTVIAVAALVLGAWGYKVLIVRGML